MSSEPDKDGSQQPEINTYEGVSIDWIVVGRTSLMSSMFTPDGCKMWNELTIVSPNSIDSSLGELGNVS
jgi:hypothetical protein